MKYPSRLIYKAIESRFYHTISLIRAGHFVGGFPSTQHAEMVYYAVSHHPLIPCILQCAVNVSAAVKVASKSFLRGNAQIAFAQPKVSVRRSQRLATRAYIREYPDPEFIEEVKQAFPEKPIATVEEGRVRETMHVIICDRIGMEEKEVILGCPCLDEDCVINRVAILISGAFL